MRMNFCRIMAAMSLRYGNNVAIVNVERARRYTFREYHLLTNRIADAMRNKLGLRKDNNVLIMLDNDNLSLLHFPLIFKQEATFAFSNQRDAVAEHVWQLDYLKPKVVFLETRMIAAYRSVLVSRGCAIVVMDHAPDLPEDIHCFWDLVDAASDQDNDIELDLHEHVALQVEPQGAASARCTPSTI